VHGHTREDDIRDDDGVEEDLRELGRVARRVLQKNVRRANGRVSDVISHAGDRVGELKEGVSHRVQEHPLQSLLIASGVGALLVLLLRGARK
jgi:ElaB/YqjD/DUF883 family membrane-anchored ribosome-binding protein